MLFNINMNYLLTCSLDLIKKTSNSDTLNNLTVLIYKCLNSKEHTSCMFFDLRKIIDINNYRCAEREENKEIYRFMVQYLLWDTCKKSNRATPNHLLWRHVLTMNLKPYNCSQLIVLKILESR